MTPEDLKSLDVDALLSLRAQIDDLLADKRMQLRSMLEKIEGQPLAPNPPDFRRELGKQRRGHEPQYRSKKDPQLTWAGRGMMPRWMRAEMQGTRLKKEDFRI